MCSETKVSKKYLFFFSKVKNFNIYIRFTGLKKRQKKIGNLTKIFFQTIDKMLIEKERKSTIYMIYSSIWFFVLLEGLFCFLLVDRKRIDRCITCHNNNFPIVWNDWIELKKVLIVFKGGHHIMVIFICCGGVYFFW